MRDTEDKLAWTRAALAVEKEFVREIVPLFDLDVIINPAKKTDKYAPDLLRNGSQLADLKCQTTPFFTSERYGIPPQYAVTFNRKDYLRYKENYPDIHIYLWVRWDVRKWHDIEVDEMESVWEAPFSQLAAYIQESTVSLHSYQRRVNDTRGNAKDSYVFDLRWLKELE